FLSGRARSQSNRSRNARISQRGPGRWREVSIATFASWPTSLLSNARFGVDATGEALPGRHGVTRESDRAGASVAAGWGAVAPTLIGNPDAPLHLVARHRRAAARRWRRRTPDEVGKRK